MAAPGWMTLLGRGPVSQAAAGFPAKGVWLGSDPLLRLSSTFPSACLNTEPCPCSPVHTRPLLPGSLLGWGWGRSLRGTLGHRSRSLRSCRSDFILQPSCNLSHFTGGKTESWRGSWPPNLSSSWRGSVLLQSPLCRPQPYPRTNNRAIRPDRASPSCSQCPAHGWDSGTIY